MAPARIWPPEEDEVGGTLATARGGAIQDWCAGLEVTLGNVPDARRFAKQYRQHFPSAGATHRGPTAWIRIRIGAGDAREAEVLAAMTVKIGAELRLVRVRPLGAKLHFVDLVGPLFGPLEIQRRLERERLIDYARRLSVQQLGGSPGAGPGGQPALAEPAPVRGLLAG